MHWLLKISLFVLGILSVRTSSQDLGQMSKEERMEFIKEVKDNLREATQDQIAAAVAIEILEQLNIQNVSPEAVSNELEQQLSQGKGLKQATSVILVQVLEVSDEQVVASTIAADYTPGCTLSGSSCDSNDRGNRFIYNNNQCVRRRICNFEGFSTRQECNDNCK
eukprot:TRINITY_DN1159_c0_g1_i1.p2 TRINITY_DN1159_c0_g1~~TRINITY_DN1159_c0_g1_i1.p2  ORF type:complete len:165 (+),score=13.04 TRINITY_DN1159_c0_g1_i1:203-697(+)